MNKTRIVFMGTPLIASSYLQKLIDNNFNIIAVYTQPPKPKGRGMSLQNSFVHDKALEHNIPLFHPINFNNKEIINTFINLKAELVVVMAYGKILPEKILYNPKKGCINVHLSLLPRWRGAAPVEYALLNGDKQTGVSIFRLVKKLDAGPILSNSLVNIEDDMNQEDLLKKLNFIGENLLVKTLNEYLDNKIDVVEQDDERATYANKILPNSRKIDFNENIIKVFNKIRAFSPQPGAWFMFQKERIKIIKCEVLIQDSTPSVIENNELYIGCAGGVIQPRILQREGKKPMGIGEFLKGFQFTVGQKVNGEI